LTSSRSAACSPAKGDLNLGSVGPGGSRPNGCASMTSTPNESSERTSQGFLSTPMLERSVGLSTQRKLIASSEDSPAKTFQMQDLEGACQKEVTHGHPSTMSSPVLLGKLNPDGSLLRMSGDYCQSTLEGGLVEYSETCPTWVMMRKGKLYELAHSVPPIKDSGYLLLGTPRACLGRKHCFQQIRTATTWETTSDLLTRLIGMEYGLTGRQKVRSKVTKHLWVHPSFLEWMMGYPPGWTEIPDLETQSFPRSLNTLDNASLIAKGGT